MRLKTTYNNSTGFVDVITSPQKVNLALWKNNIISEDYILDANSKHLESKVQESGLILSPIDQLCFFLFPMSIIVLPFIRLHSFDFLIFPLNNFAILIVLFINTWGSGYIFLTLFKKVMRLFSSNNHPNNDSEELGYNFQKEAFLIHRILLPVSFGITFLYFFGLSFILITPHLDIREVFTKTNFLLNFFIFAEFLLYFGFWITIMRFISLSRMGSLENEPKFLYFIKKIKEKVILYVKEIIIILNSLLTLFLGVLIAEINYNYGQLNLLIVNLFYFSIITLVISRFFYDKESILLDFIIIFVLSFSLTHSFIGRGPTFVGRTDIHKEFFYAQYSITTMSWDPNSFVDNFNTIISITVLPMLLNYIFSINIEMFFVWVLPTMNGLFNIGCYILLRVLYVKKNLLLDRSRTLKNVGKKAIFFTFLLLFIRSYSHMIAASARIIISYYFFILICVILIENKVIKDLPQNIILIILSLSTLLSHWGAIFFGIAIISVSIFFFLLYRATSFNFRSRNLVNRQSAKKIYSILTVFIITILVIAWYFVITTKIVDFLTKNVLGTLEASLSDFDLEEYLLEINNILIYLRIINFENPIIFSETVFVNLVFVILFGSSIFLNLIINIKRKNIHFTDFFGLSILIVCGLMIIFPVLTYFYSPFRVAIQLWPFLIPICYVKINGVNSRKFSRIINEIILKTGYLNNRIFSKLFILFVIVFHQGLIYNVAFPSDTITTSIAIELDESISLMFENYGAEAWRWILTESDLEAISWLNSQNPWWVYADFPRAYMLLTRLDGFTPVIPSPQNATIPITWFIDDNEPDALADNTYVFISSQNIASGYLFFENRKIPTITLIEYLENTRGVLVYSQNTSIYFYPGD